MDKCSDNLSSALPGGEVTPNTVAALLRKLELTTAPRAQQATAIAKWLTANDPSTLMSYSLRHSEFSGLLERRARR